MDDLYNILQIDENATQIEIKKAYIKLVKQYHPDKNKEAGAHDMFIKIQYAYDILSNNKIKKDYYNLNFNDKINCFDILQKILNNSININEFNKYFSKICETDFEYIKLNFLNFIQSINIIELIDLYKNGTLKKKNFLTYSDSESETNIEYYYNLPIYLQKNNSLDIKIDIQVELSDVLENNKRKIKIKRNVNNKIIISTFIFDLTHPYVVFIDGGDIKNKIITDNYINGNLIIKIILSNNYYWDYNIIFIDYPMNLYELIYGIKINIDDIISLDYWIPYNDGFIIDITKNVNLAIKLYLNYTDNEINKEFLKQISY